MKVQRLAERRSAKWHETRGRMTVKRIPVRERFFGKVRKDDSGCHEWTGWIAPNGYGQVSRDCKPAYSHRVAWELANGPIPAGLYVLHKCDNRKCVNPDHLFLGTLQDNVADMVRKGRHASGNKNGRRKLSSDQIDAIRRSDDVQTKIAARFGVSQANVSTIKAGRSWKVI